MCLTLHTAIMKLNLLKKMITICTDADGELSICTQFYF
jgi:hypothetical protein